MDPKIFWAGPFVIATFIELRKAVKADPSSES
jgi:hypothetical protein